VTFFLIGVWHGRTSEFIVFGILTGTGMSINKLWQIWLARKLGRKGYKSLAANALYIAFGRGLNFVWFAFTLSWFWGSWKQIAAVYTGLTGGGWLAVWTAAWIFMTAVLALWEWLRQVLLSIRTATGPALTSRYARVAYASAMGMVALIMTELLKQAAPDIVYKAF
jgi:D-alanyl-lipoteichoic acid acyltransferase DltB (MBOAT superfamily)